MFTSLFGLFLFISGFCGSIVCENDIQIQWKDDLRVRMEKTLELLRAAVAEAKQDASAGSILARLEQAVGQLSSSRDILGQEQTWASMTPHDAYEYLVNAENEFKRLVGGLLITEYNGAVATNAKKWLDILKQTGKWVHSNCTYGWNGKSFTLNCGKG